VSHFKAVYGINLKFGTFCLLGKAVWG